MCQLCVFGKGFDDLMNGIFCTFIIRLGNKFSWILFWSKFWMDGIIYEMMCLLTKSARVFFIWPEVSRPFRTSLLTEISENSVSSQISLALRQFSFASALSSFWHASRSFKFGFDLDLFCTSAKDSFSELTFEEPFEGNFDFTDLLVVSWALYKCLNA